MTCKKYQPNFIFLSTTRINPQIIRRIIITQKISHNEKGTRLLKKEKNFAIEGYAPSE